MAQICLYFELHQPRRLAAVPLTMLGSKVPSFFSLASGDENQVIFSKVAKKSYYPMLGLLKKLLAFEPNFTFALSLSGVFIEQAQEYEPEIITLLQQLCNSGRVEFLAETYYHSLASLYSHQEFAMQVALHQECIKKLFGIAPRIFRNTELIYSNNIAEQVAAFGFAGMLTEAVPRYLGDRPPTQVYESATKDCLPLLLKQAQLSDDVAFRFSDRNWQWYPLTVERYLEWFESYSSSDCINLFMDFETFGEHQWQETGIFEFFQKFVSSSLANKKHRFVTPSVAIQRTSVGTYDVPEPISWADVDRDLTAWTGNAFQLDTLNILYSLEEKVKKSRDENILANWRLLQTSDHFYYMCTKWSADGDVHAYFSPYDTPFEAYRQYAVVLAHLRESLE
ncbi:MAG: alpha-amylase [Candidatus Pacebacteria bacterium]|nr:alpha-amylase [Candidatus Paceibacterota bacterium]PIR60555.1 MAG: alpha-amylase [Candidatus Pacebacteria bacterium CG10_big_fil_rev_8_21_14_0_10_44_54]